MYGSLFEVYGATQATQLMLAIFPLWMDLPYIKWLDIATMLDQHDLALLWGVTPLMYKFLCVDVYECLVAEKIELKSMERLKENRDQEHSLYKCMDAVRDDFIYNERELSYLGVEKKSIYLMRERLYKEGAIRSAC